MVAMRPDKLPRPSDIALFCHDCEERTLSLSEIDGYIQDGILTVPEGVTQVGGDYDHGSLHFPVAEIRLPDTVVSIQRLGCESADPRGLVVTLPRGLRELSRFGLDNLRELRIYNTTAISGPGRKRSLIHLTRQEGVSRDTGFDIAVLDVDTDRVLYKVWCPHRHCLSQALLKLNEKVWSTKNCANAANFSLVDEMYKDLKALDKIHVAINRLRWPIELSCGNEQLYKSYIRHSTKKVLEELSRLDDAEALGFLAENGLLSESGKLAFLTSFDASKSPSVAAILTASTDRVAESAEKRLVRTPAQAAEVAYAKFEQGDGSGVADLAPVAKKVNKVMRVSLLELAAAACGPDVIDALYGLFGDFDFTCNALALAIIGGKVENAFALKRHGATLDYKLPVPSKKYLYYTHGKYDLGECSLVGYGYYNHNTGACLAEGATYAALFLPERRRYMIPHTGKFSPCFKDRKIEVVTESLTALCEAGVLSEAELGSLFLSAAFFEHVDFARKLAGYYPGDAIRGNVDVRRGGNLLDVGLASPVDLLWRGCSKEVAELAVEFGDASEVSAWAKSSMPANLPDDNFELFALLFEYVESDYKGLVTALLRSAERGRADIVERLLSLDEGLATKARLKRCIDVASEHNHVATVALLLEKQEQLFGCSGGALAL